MMGATDRSDRNLRQFTEPCFKVMDPTATLVNDFNIIVETHILIATVVIAMIFNNHKRQNM